MSGPSAEHGVSPTGRSLARDPHKEETCCGKWSRKQQVFPKPTNILVVAAMGLVRADLHLVAAIYLVRGRGCCGLLSILILGALFERSYWYQASASPQRSYMKENTQYTALWRHRAPRALVARKMRRTGQPH